jgi:CheY-like chemotaxis protein
VRGAVKTNETTRKPSILIVDSNEFILSCLGDYLASAGFNVVTTSTAEKALKYLQRGEPDLIVLELNLTGMGGVGFLNRISTVAGRLKYPVLVFTEREDLEDFCGNLGIAGFLSKKEYGPRLGQMILEILERTAREKERETAWKTKRVLLIEDDASIVDSLRRLLAGKGYAVEVAASGAAGLRLAEQFKPDVIVVKAVLPAMNGREVCERLYASPATRPIPVVLHDETRKGASGPRYETKASQGVQEFLTTSDPPALFEAVQRVLGK